MTNSGSRRRSDCRLPILLGLTGMIAVFSSCAAHRGQKDASRGHDEVSCTNGTSLPIQRRFFVSSQGRLGINGEPGSFARELTASLNATPNCTAIMLPLDFPLHATPESGSGMSPQLARWVEMAGPSPAVDELLIVSVTDVVPFRPMRIGAVLECRSLADGTVLWREQRTWNAPLDMDPISPSPINRVLLNRPPPLGVVEKHELNRLSPQTFQRSVAEKVAAELALSPL